MLSALPMDRILKRKGSFPPYRETISVDMRALFVCTRSSSVLWVSKSLDGREGCVPIHSYTHCQYHYSRIVVNNKNSNNNNNDNRDNGSTSAYGLSASTEKPSMGVAAAYLAAADSEPTLPVNKSRYQQLAMPGAVEVPMRLSATGQRRRAGQNRACSPQS